MGGAYFYSYETYYIHPKNQLERDARPEYLDQCSGRLHFVGLSSFKKNQPTTKNYQVCYQRKVMHTSSKQAVKVPSQRACSVTDNQITQRLRILTTSN